MKVTLYPSEIRFRQENDNSYRALMEKPKNGKKQTKDIPNKKKEGKKAITPKKTVSSTPKLDSKYEVLVTAKNYNNLTKLFVFPKDARKNKEYKNLEKYMKEKYPQFNDIEEDDFHNCLDESIVQYLLRNNIEIRDDRMIIQFDGKKIFEDGWFPLPSLSDSLPRGYIVDIFLGIIAGTYGYNNIESYETRSKELPNPPLRLFDNEEEEDDTETKCWQIIVEERDPPYGTIMVYLIPEDDISKKLKIVLNKVASSDENDFHKVLSYNIKKKDKKDRIKEKIEETISFFSNYETDLGDVDNDMKITTILPFFLDKREHDYRLYE